jgi:GrpB-like predicted nucleotidyltransferase (UPF0157 family)
MPIKILPYDPAWREEFQRIGATLRQTLGDHALRINHIGSTSVPGLAAKNIIDVQISVAALTPTIEAAMTEHGFTRHAIDRDHQPPSMVTDPAQWTKWLFHEPNAYRPCNLHMRIEGRANQRYALLFRDYLRANPLAAQAYAQVKIALADRHADDTAYYYDVKDPVCDIIIAGAEGWAKQSHWTLPATDA